MPYWRRTLYTLWFTQFIAIAGFSFVSPFIPFYIQSLGIHDVAQVALWTGFSSSACSIALALMAPIWGGLSDRHGRKMMVLRATLLGAAVLAAQGLVANVQQLVALRFVQGIFTGTIAASTTLVASVVPEEHRGAALGSLQTAVYLGTMLGPLLGGVVGDAVGYRESFWVTGALLLLSGLLVAVFVREHFRKPTTLRTTRRPGYGQALSFLFASGGVLVALLAARILLRAGMIVPSTVMALFVQSLPGGAEHPAVITGLVAGGAALGGALGAPLLGDMGDRWGYRRMLVVTTLLLAASFLPQAVARNAFWLAGWQAVAGFAEGGTLACTMALLAGFAEGGRQGTIFGLDASATGLASAAGPLLGAAAAAGFGLRAPFVMAAIILFAGASVVLLRIRPGAETPTPAALPAHPPGS